MGVILVAGSAHLDILAQAKDRNDVIDRIGEVHIEIGGTACNIAINLAHSGAKSRLLSALNYSAYSKVIAEYLSEAGVEMHIEYHAALPTGGFSAHIDTAGEMVSAVSATPVEQILFGYETVRAAMDGVKAVMLDCNLSEETLNQLCDAANALGIPVYLLAVSEEKSLRISSVQGRIKGIFINQKEFAFFCNQIYGRQKPPTSVAIFLGAMLMLTQGEQGSTLAMPDGESWRIPAADIGGGGSRLGMGDALAAAVVHAHEIEGHSIKDSTIRALVQVASVGSSRHCHHGSFGALESAIERIKHGVSHDGMTNLLNRSALEMILREALARQQRGLCKHLSILILDIDHFKSVNDTYGHNAGDEVIVNLGSVAQSCLRESDYLGRWGGEEFVVLLLDTPRDTALRVAERIRATVAEKMKSPRQITVSVGCCVANGEPDIRTLVERADKALYAAKRGGRNRVELADNTERCTLANRTDMDSELLGAEGSRGDNARAPMIAAL